MHSTWELQQEVQVHFLKNLARKEEIEAVYRQNNRKIIKGEEKMRITDLLDRRSVSLTAAPKNKVRNSGYGS